MRPPSLRRALLPVSAMLLLAVAGCPGREAQTHRSRADGGSTWAHATAPAPVDLPVPAERQPAPQESAPVSAAKAGTDGPGEAAAVQAALAGCSDWVATVHRHSADWQTVTVRIGPPNTSWLMEIGLQWVAEARCYDVVEERESPAP